MFAMVPEGGIVPVGADRASGCVRTQIWTAAVPGAIGEDVGIGQRHRTAACHIAEWVLLCIGLL